MNSHSKGSWYSLLPLSHAALCFLRQARFWVQVMRDLREGVKLKKVKERQYNPLPIEYQLTPYEMLMDDIRSKRYKLRKVMVSVQFGRHTNATRCLLPAALLLYYCCNLTGNCLLSLQLYKYTRVKSSGWEAPLQKGYI